MSHKEVSNVVPILSKQDCFARLESGEAFKAFSSLQYLDQFHSACARLFAKGGAK